MMKILKYSAILPGLIITLFFALFVFYGQFLDFGSMGKMTPQDAVKFGLVGNGLKGRYFWGISALMVTVALFWNMAISLIIIRRYIENTSIAHKVIQIGILSLSLIPISMLAFGWSIPGEIVNTIHNIIFVKTKIDITNILDALNVLAFLVLLSIASALGALLNKSSNNELSAKDISSRFEWANISLYSAAALLAVGVIEVYAQYSWCAEFLEGDIKAAYATTAGVLAFSAGAVFSTLLLILYMPVALIHRSWLIRALHNASENDADFDVEQWLKRHALDKTVLKSFGKFSSVVFPVIVGAIIKLFFQI